ncbi:MAG: hypothetical protein OEY14_16310, partial [Myxococcales bacterium]|nr:hypothetical protein [Myxococcales bacterium]
GIFITFILAQVGIFLGSLEAIAPVLTMFFLATYGMTNLACGLEKWAASPSYRPSFNTPTFVSIGAGLACFYVMSIIDLKAMVGALFFCAVIFVIVERRTLNTTYGDARHGIWAALVRSALHRLRRVEWHPLNWRPNLVILGGNPQKRAHLLHLGSAIVQDRGLVTYFQLLQGSVPEQAALRRELFAGYDSKIAERFPNVFYRVDIVPDLFTGTVQVAQSYGIGNFEANSVMLGWSKKPERADAYVQMLRDLASLDRSLLLVSYDEGRQFGEGREIHIWWGGLQGNGGLMLLLAFLLTAHHRWRQAKVVVLTVVEDKEARAAAISNLQRLLSAARLEGEPRVLLRQGRSIADIMHIESERADLAIMGIRLPDPQMPAGPFFERINRMLEQLPSTILVHGARNFESEPVLFDDGRMPSMAPPTPASVPVQEVERDALRAAGSGREDAEEEDEPAAPRGAE